MLRLILRRLTYRKTIVAVLLCFGGLVMMVGGSELRRSDPEPVYFGDAVPGMSPGQKAQFESGFRLFSKVWTAEEGLGPLLNAKSCSNCHHIPVPGGTEFSPDTFVVQSADRSGEGSESFPRFELTPKGIIRRTLPTRFELRKTQSLYGIGLLEAVPQSELAKIADPNDRNRDGISGRLQTVDDGYGRFGWKAQSATLEHFVRTAFHNEMGLTTSHSGVAHPEVSDIEIAAVTHYLRSLAPPPRRQAAVEEGERLFRNIQCAACHTPRLSVSGFIVGGIHAIQPFSDLLLHDMGPELCDRSVGDARPCEFRTPPLWGLSSAGPPYLHDGRAENIDEAIRAHGGEAGRSSSLYRRLGDHERRALIEFLRSL